MFIQSKYGRYRKHILQARCPYNGARHIEQSINLFTHIKLIESMTPNIRKAKTLFQKSTNVSLQRPLKTTSQAGKLGKQESLANAKVSARQPWCIGRNSLNCVFFIPLSYSAPMLPMYPLEFCGEVKRQKTRFMGLLCGEGCVILTSTVFD